MAKRGTPLLPNERLPIDGAMLEEIARDEKLNLESGGVLLSASGVVPPQILIGPDSFGWLSSSQQNLSRRHLNESQRAMGSRDGPLLLSAAPSHERLSAESRPAVPSSQ